MPTNASRRRAGRLIALSLTATTVVGLGALHSPAHAADPINPATGCSEDSFLAGGANPAAGSTVSLPLGGSQVFSVVYHDESAINMNPGFAPAYTVADASGHVVQSGVPATSPASAPAGTKDKFNTLVSVSYTALNAGRFNITIKAWDGDQNKKGGDCGAASWTIDTPAPPTTTTIPHHDTTTTTQPQGTTTTTTEPSTPQTNVLGETFAQSPAAPAVNGTPALTG
jgi:hypothetical protein